MTEQQEQPNFLDDINTMLLVRAEEMRRYYNEPHKLKELYFTIAHDIAIVNSEKIDYIKRIRDIKKKKAPSYTKISEFTRDIELTDEHIVLKSCSLTAEALDKIMFAVQARAKNLDIEAKGFSNT